MYLKEGCTSCGRLWKEPDAEGQCSRCRRCLACCGKENVRYTCAWRYSRMTPQQLHKSKVAYERWENHVNVLGHNRRIT
jgi:predicted aldo/keto reductase-like oxidoreductase